MLSVRFVELRCQPKITVKMQNSQLLENKNVYHLNQLSIIGNYILSQDREEILGHWKL